MKKRGSCEKSVKSFWIPHPPHHFSATSYSAFPAIYVLDLRLRRVSYLLANAATTLVVFSQQMMPVAAARLARTHKTSIYIPIRTGKVYKTTWAAVVGFFVVNPHLPPTTVLRTLLSSTYRKKPLRGRSYRNVKEGFGLGAFSCRRYSKFKRNFLFGVSIDTVSEN